MSKITSWIKVSVGTSLAIVACLPLNNAAALSPADYAAQSIDFYSANAGTCTAPSTTGVGTTAGGEADGKGNADYKGRQIVSDAQMKKVKENQPIYEKASQEVKIPWQLIAVIHLRESGLSRTNPGNGQGIYQFVAGNGGPYPPGSVNDAEFLRQTIFAAKFIRGKAGAKKEKLAAGDPDAIKDTLFSYNGRAAVYTRQAKQLGFDNGYEGSPYVMNIADAKRDPGVNKTTWGQIKLDGGGLAYPANSDYGAFVIYAALAGIPSSGGACAGSGAIDPRVGENGWEATGTNAMVLYYQNKAPWANQKYGKGTIEECGCGPTSMAMAVATLKKDKSVTPKVMADYFASNGGQVSDPGKCASTWALFSSSSVLAKKYGLEITDLGTDMSKVAAAVKRGSFVYMSQSRGIFTSGGHLMLIRAVTANGNYRVADPISEKNTTNETGYTAGQIKASLVKLWEVRLKG